MADPPLEQPIDSLTLAEGVWLEDDWFALRQIDEGTLAIGEPAYQQCNWSYLISDAGDSLLWDTGSGRRPIAPLVARHGQDRVHAFPSHMHYDHLGGITGFGPVILADLPVLRAVEQDGQVTPSDDMFLGAYENLPTPTFPVGRWVKPGAHLMIGKRYLEVLHTPGHSPDSVSLWEESRQRLYAADLIYPGPLYAQVPGASLTAYAETLTRLLSLLPETVDILCAHGDAEQSAYDMPKLGYGDLADTLATVQALLTEPPHDGERQVNARMTLLYSKASYTA